MLFRSHLSYLTCLFWGPLQGDASYAPTWGGILNPLLGAGFFIGFFDLCGDFKKKGLAIIPGFLICLLPAFLAGDYVELNRIIQVLPFLLLISAMGFSKMLAAIDNGNLKKVAFLILLLSSSGLDLIHYFKPVCSYGSLGPSDSGLNPDLRAFQIFKTMNREQGPGLIYTEFLPLKYGHSLYVTTYSFNAASNKKMEQGKCHWAGIVIPSDFQPFLSARFPGSKWYLLQKIQSPSDLGLAVGILGVNPGNFGLFGDWTLAQDLFQRFQLDAERSFNNKKAYLESIRAVTASYGLIPQDPFLRTCYWEWASQYFWDPKGSTNIALLQKAIGEGYPAAHLYRKLALLLETQGRPDQARLMLEKSKKKSPEFTVDEHLEILK